MDFDATASALLERHGFKPRTPREVLHWWSEFVDQCVDGYDWTLYEFDDEMGVRDYIEILLTSHELARFPEHREFTNSVRKIDDPGPAAT